MSEQLPRVRFTPMQRLFIEAYLVSKNITKCTACSFWDTGLNPTPPWRRVEVASHGAPPG